ncbi:UPF0147 family protein [Candidatus Woesearchaeota archaeon]|nr:UPF0147 family protein [Candidatus Woesearchaeota archaeon]
MSNAKVEGEEISSVIDLLDELKEDSTVPKNVRVKIDGMISNLNGDVETQIKVSKVLSELEVISEDVNLQSYTRTQIWDIVSLLEKVK